MLANAQEVSASKRRLILHDALAFLSLIAVTVALFAVTLFLFRSFEGHRAELATRWAGRGLTAFESGDAKQAIAAYRAALSYAPEERSYELRLAQALGQAGRTEEAYNYFLGLWDTQPGDGFINLQLARLAAAKRDVESAINFYRGSIYGTWEGDGVARRREVRLELARYLIAQNQPGPARAELLVAAGNAPDSAAMDVTLAGLLEQAGAAQDALGFYQKAVADEPENHAALSAGGRLAFRLGDYETAERLLAREVHADAGRSGDAAMLTEAARVLQLRPADTLPANELVGRILTMRGIAKRRLAACAAEVGTGAGLPAALEALQARWVSSAAGRAALIRDAEKQQAAVQLIYDTELAASQAHCTAATGDDAALLLLAHGSPLEGVSHR